MKSNIPCSVVRDLLPSYMEDLVEEETKGIIDAHLKECEACQKLYESMKSPHEKEENKEIDYLKKVKKRNSKKVIRAVAITCIVFILGLAADVFFIGTEVKEPALNISQVDDGTLQVNVINPNSAKAFRSFKIETEGTTCYLRAREVLVSPFSQNLLTANIPLEGLDKVEAFGKVIWEKDKIITERAHRLFESRTPYIGSMVNVAGVTANLRWISKDLENRLHTDKEPYGLEIYYKEPLTEKELSQVRENAPFLLALIDNMGEFIISYPNKNGERQEEVISLEDISSHLPEKIEKYNSSNSFPIDENTPLKDFSKSPYMVEILLEIFEY